MRNFFWGIISILFLTVSQAQTTSNCLEIENILVDACGNPEGQNEMLRILVGPNPLTVNNISISWPNNTFYGFVMNATTAAHTNTLNSTIQGCGYILEPLNGIIPANKKAIIVTSYMMNPNNNSFANLMDTVYILFQNSIQTAGHFANAGTGIRTTTITYNACSEMVSYNRNNLINTDGAGVSFTQNGTATYYTGGCNAPVSTLVVDAQIAGNPTSFCAGSSLNIQASWSGANGTFLGWIENGNGNLTNPNSASTTYNSVVPEVGTITFVALVSNVCGDTIIDSVSISIIPPQAFQITPGIPLELCQGQSLTLSVPSGTYTNGPNWSNSVTGNSITVTSPGTYFVEATDPCYTYSDTVIITPGSDPTVTLNAPTTIQCSGQAIVLTATGVNGSLAWSTGDTTSSISASSSGTYIVTATNACGSVSDTVNIQIFPSGPTADFSFNGNTMSPTTIVFDNNSSNASSYDWTLADQSTSTEFSPSQYFNSGGEYNITLVVTDDNGCQDSISKTLLIEELVSISMPNIITPNGDNVNDIFSVTATGIDEYKLLVFNRWGQLVYVSTDINEGWNAKSKTGQLVVQGVYSVIVNYTIASSGKGDSVNGHVTVLY